MFKGKDSNSKLEFHWIPFERLQDIEAYPPNVAELVNHIEGDVQRFIYRENI